MGLGFDVLRVLRNDITFPIIKCEPPIYNTFLKGIPLKLIPFKLIPLKLIPLTFDTLKILSQTLNNPNQTLEPASEKKTDKTYTKT